MKAFALVTKARAKTSPFLPGPLSISNTLLHRGGQSVGEFRHFFDRGIIAGGYGSIDARLQIAQLAQPADDAPANRLDHSGDVGIAVRAWPCCRGGVRRILGLMITREASEERKETAPMSRVLPGTAPQVVALSQADMQPAFTWIEAHADACRGQWVAVRLVDPVLVASAPTLTQLWQMASPTLLKDCVLQYIGTVENAHQPQGPGWDV